MQKKGYDKKVLAKFLPLTTENSFYNADPLKTNHVSYLVKTKKETVVLDESVKKFAVKGRGLENIVRHL